MKGWVDVRECLISFGDLKESDVVTHIKVDNTTSTRVPIDQEDHQIDLVVNNKKQTTFINAWMDLIIVYFITTEKDEKTYLLKERLGQKAVWSLSQLRGFLTHENALKYIQKSKTCQQYTIKNADVDTLV